MLLVGGMGHFSARCFQRHVDLIGRGHGGNGVDDVHSTVCNAEGREELDQLAARKANREWLAGRQLLNRGSSMAAEEDVEDVDEQGRGQVEYKASKSKAGQERERAVMDQLFWL